MKPSQLARYSRKAGTFCSISCAAIFKRTFYAGSRNPNYKGRNTDCDGYRIHVPTASGIGSDNYLGRMKLHQAVCCSALGISKMPKGVHIHHRDCDVLNNEPWNLAVMTVSDYKWIHKQYGIATLWALMHGKASLDDLVSWSDEKHRAEWLLLSCIDVQADISRMLGDGNLITHVAEVKPVRAEFSFVDEIASGKGGA